MLRNAPMLSEQPSPHNLKLSICHVAQSNRGLKHYCRCSPDPIVPTGPDKYPENIEEFQASHPELYKATYAASGPCNNPLSDQRRKMLWGIVPCRSPKQGCRHLGNSSSNSSIGQPSMRSHMNPSFNTDQPRIDYGRVNLPGFQWTGSPKFHRKPTIDLGPQTVHGLQPIQLQM